MTDHSEILTSAQSYVWEDPYLGGGGGGLLRNLILCFLRLLCYFQHF